MKQSKKRRKGCERIREKCIASMNECELMRLKCREYLAPHLATNG